jgi:hypothetical protein
LFLRRNIARYSTGSLPDNPTESLEDERQHRGLEVFLFEDGVRRPLIGVFQLESLDGNHLLDKLRQFEPGKYPLGAEPKTIVNSRNALSTESDSCTKFSVVLRV